jgi:hypothetical protein
MSRNELSFGTYVQVYLIVRCGVVWLSQLSVKVIPVQRGNEGISRILRLLICLGVHINQYADHPPLTSLRRGTP